MLANWWQEAVPPELSWLFAILGVLAFLLAVLATPSIAQMVWGRAQLQTEYQTDANGKDRSLIVFLTNPPVKQGFLKRIGVHRVAVQSLEASFGISEAGSGTVLDPIRHAQFKSPDDPSDEYFSPRIVLPPTYSVGALLMIAIWDHEHARAVVPPDRLRSALALPEGLYHIQIIFQVDGEPRREERRFRVGQSADDLTWIPVASA